MITYIKNLDGAEGIYSVAKSKEVFDKLCLSHISAVFIDNDKFFCYPSGLFHRTDEAETLTLGMLENYDCIYIDKRGILNRLFSVSSDDNALVLTSKCSSNCIMCPDSEAHRRRGVYDLRFICGIINHLPDDTSFLTVTGGEPTLIGEGFFTVMSMLKDRLPYTKFLLLTNGRAFCSHDFVRKFLKCRPQKIRIGIPIYGGRAEVHDSITQTPESFAQASAGIKNIISAGCETELRVVVSKLNYKYMDELADYIIHNFKKLAAINFMGLEMLGNAAKNRDHVWIDYKTAFKSARLAIKKLIMAGYDVNLYNFPLCCVDPDYWPICCRSISDYKVRYCSDCGECMVKAICGGIFEGSRRLCEGRLEPVISI